MTADLIMDILRIILGLTGLWIVWQVFNIFTKLNRNSAPDLSNPESSNDEPHP
jgi:uncharacterized membrane protein YuzA (DUF378 family)